MPLDTSARVGQIGAGGVSDTLLGHITRPTFGNLRETSALVGVESSLARAQRGPGGAHSVSGALIIVCAVSA